MRRNLPIVLVLAALAIVVGWSLRSRPSAGPISATSARVSTPSLPSSAAAAAELQIFESFVSWLALHRAADASGSRVAATLDEGVRIAQGRRLRMIELIRTDPEAALEWALGWDEWATLPDAIREHVERPFSETATFVYVDDAGGEHPTWLRFEDSGAPSQEAYVFGRRESLRSKRNVPLQGIELAGLRVLRETPVQPIEGADLVAALAHLSEGNPRDRSFVTGEPIAGEPDAALIGGRVHYFETEGEIEQVSDAIAAAEATLGPNVPTWRRDQAGAAGAWFDPGPLGAAAAAGPAAWTEGPLTVLSLRVDFTPLVGGDRYSESQITEAFVDLDPVIQDMSYGKTSVSVTTVPGVVQLDETLGHYEAGGRPELDQGFARIRAALPALGFDPDDYDALALFFPGIEGIHPIFNTGMEVVFLGEARTQLVTGLAHEIGHIYGATHANAWYGIRAGQGLIERKNFPADAGAAPHGEYGDPFDLMGNDEHVDPGGDPVWPNGHFGMRNKFHLGWIEPGEVTDVTEEGTYRVHRFDDPAARDAQNPLALRITGPTGHEYWVGLRKNFPNNPTLGSGAYVVWAQSDRFIDTTPLSVTERPAGSPQLLRVLDLTDGGLLPGRSWTDPDGTVRITTLRSGGAAPNEFIDVTVTFPPADPGSASGLFELHESVPGGPGLNACYVPVTLPVVPADLCYPPLAPVQRLETLPLYVDNDRGEPSALGLADFNDFGVQYNGWIEVHHASRFAVYSRWVSYVWLDLDGGGLGTAEFLLRPTPLSGDDRFTPFSTLVQPGIYPIQIQQFSGGKKTFQLVAEPDRDQDGWIDRLDNCQSAANPGQQDLDSDGLGDVCDSDQDNDGLPNQWEIDNGSDPFDPADAASDPDFDGFTQTEEFDAGSDGADFDSNPMTVPPLALSGHLHTEPLHPGARFGSSVARIGDVDGDGVTDLAVGAAGFIAGRGAILVYFMNPDGTVRAFQLIAENADGFNAGLVPGDRFGAAVTALGDLDLDGVPDVAVGAPGDEQAGAVFVLFLQADGRVKAHHQISAFSGDLDLGLLGLDAFGEDLVSPGDLDGNGLPELAVGVPGHDLGGTNTGAVWLLFLDTDGTVRDGEKLGIGSGGLGSLTIGSEFGRGMGAPGDLGQDGVPDLLVGAPSHPTVGGSGEVWRLHMNPDGTVASASTANSAIVGPLEASEGFGTSLAQLGDIDGDGVPETLVGSPFRDDGGIDTGAIRAVELDSDGLRRKISATVGGFPGTLSPGDNFGADVAVLGDLDGDGTLEIAVGAPGHDHSSPFPQEDGGAVWLLHLGVAPAVCGDGILDPREACDDGGSNDRCGSSCQEEFFLEFPGTATGPGWVEIAFGSQAPIQIETGFPTLAQTIASAIGGSAIGDRIWLSERPTRVTSAIPGVTPSASPRIPVKSVPPPKYSIFYRVEGTLAAESADPLGLDGKKLSYSWSLPENLPPSEVSGAANLNTAGWIREVSWFAGDFSHFGSFPTVVLARNFDAGGPDAVLLGEGGSEAGWSMPPVEILFVDGNFWTFGQVPTAPAFLSASVASATTPSSIEIEGTLYTFEDVTAVGTTARSVNYSARARLSISTEFEPEPFDFQGLDGALLQMDLLLDERDGFLPFFRRGVRGVMMLTERPGGSADLRFHFFPLLSLDDRSPGSGLPDRMVLSDSEQYDLLIRTPSLDVQFVDAQAYGNGAPGLRLFPPLSLGPIGTGKLIDLAFFSEYDLALECSAFDSPFPLSLLSTRRTFERVSGPDDAGLDEASLETQLLLRTVASGFEPPVAPGLWEYASSVPHAARLRREAEADLGFAFHADTSFLNAQPPAVGSDRVEISGASSGLSGPLLDFPAIEGHFPDQTFWDSDGLPYPKEFTTSELGSMTAGTGYSPLDGSLYANHVQAFTVTTVDPGLCRETGRSIPDEDGDGVHDAVDGCPAEADPLQPDADRDRVNDACDVCRDVTDAGQEDSDADGFGNACDCDFDQDGDCDIDDFQIFLAAFIGGPGPMGHTDMTGDGVVNIDDFQRFLAGFVRGIPGP